MNMVHRDEPQYRCSPYVREMQGIMEREQMSHAGMHERTNVPTDIAIYGYRLYIGIVCRSLASH